MKLPILDAKNGSWSERWTPVRSGRQNPDEYQQAVMDTVQKALDSGLHYLTDVYTFCREHMDFIPADWWDMQFNQAVERGCMGMEIYMARDTLSEQVIREENWKAMTTLVIGQNLGTLYVNTKRATGCTIIEMDVATCQIKFQGKMGKNTVQFSVRSGAIQTMIERAIARGWRKS